MLGLGKGVRVAYCHGCGEQVGEDWAFCRSCGQQLTPGTPAADGHMVLAAKPRGRRWAVAGLVAVLLASGAGIAVLVDDRTGNGADVTAKQASATDVPLANTSTDEPTSTGTPTVNDVPADFADLFDRSADGVVHVDAISCDGGGTGTGFLYGDHVATAAHVVSNATTIGLTLDDTTVTATVIGIDPEQDLALLEPSRTLDGHRFEFADDDLRVGQPVAALGFPGEEGLTFTQGAISGLDRRVEWPDGTETSSLVQTDAALNQGNSGGPLLGEHGNVVGVVVIKNVQAEGISYAVEADTAQARLDRWARSPRPQPPAACDRPLGPSGSTQVPPATADPVAMAIAATLTTYFIGINEGNYELAWSQLSPASQQRNPLSEFAAATSTSYDFNFQVRDAAQTAPDRARVWLTFTSIQGPGYGPDGETCTDWSLDYEMLVIDGRWRIDRVTPHTGSGHRPCG